MIDPPRVLQATSAVLGSSSGAESKGAGNFLEVLMRAGIDPATLWRG